MVVENIEYEKVAELSEDFAKLFQVDISKNVSLTSEIVEETLTRLEEFFSVITLVQGESSENKAMTLLKYKQELSAMGDLVDRLESMVAHVAQTVNDVETRLIACEMDTDDGKGNILNLFKPFFKPQEPPANQFAANAAVYEPPEIYNTSDFFEMDEEKE